ncbi:MAG: hypothetical protein IKU62_04120, partial [Ruminiclostridium sp.]|nr:hypothetical protein [Ruminiclostridium sp.]
MSHSFFAYIARMRYIGRWGLMRNTVQENIQEHSHMVAVLAHALAVIRRDKFGGDVDPGHVAVLMFVQGGQSLIWTLGRTEEHRRMLLLATGRKW